jgi:hypothetical protein
MAHQVIECTHCGEKHGRPVCDACRKEIGRDDPFLQLSSVQMCGDWPREMLDKQQQYGMSSVVLCAHCAGLGVDLSMVITRLRIQFEPRLV